MKTTQTLRTWWRTVHLWLGLASGLVVVVVSLTGCLYVFEEEIRDVTQTEQRFVKPQPQQPRQSVNAMLAGLAISFPHEKPRQVRTYAATNRAYVVHFENDKAVSWNPYTGRFTTQYARQDWLAVVEKLHTSLLLGEVGKWIIRVNILIFLALLITGLVLWWPKAKAQLRQAFSLKWNASGKRLNYDLHNVGGFYASWFLLVITLTGMWWSFDWTKRAVYFMTGSHYEKPKPVLSDTTRQLTRFPAANAYQQATLAHPGFNEVHLTLPKNAKEAVRVRLIYPYNWFRKSNHLFFDQFSGRLLKTELFTDYSAGDKVKHTNYDLHTGRLFGLPGKILAFLVSLFAASLPITGFYIWWNKRRKGKRPRHVQTPPASRIATNQRSAATPKPRPVYRPKPTVISS